MLDFCVFLASCTISVRRNGLQMTARLAPLRNCAAGIKVINASTLIVDGYTLSGGLDPVHGRVPGYAGLGVIIFATTDTTIVTTTVTGRDTILGFLALLGGAYGILYVAPSYRSADHLDSECLFNFVVPVSLCSMPCSLLQL